MQNPYSIIVRPHITEKSSNASFGDPRLSDDEVVRRYTFEVATSANKIEIKRALEYIYNNGKKKSDTQIEVTNVRTIVSKGKTRRVNIKYTGKRPDVKKAIITLAPGQRLEDYGV